jgi:hypothetical protein
MSDQIEAIREAVEARYADVRNNRDLNGDAKRRQIATAYVDAKAKLDKLAADSTASATDHRTTLSRKLFGIPNQADASAMISYRDAQDRAATIDKVADAIALMNRASMSGDDLLVRAVLEQAYDSQWPTVVDTYIALNPANADAASELWDITTRRGPSAIVNFFEFFTPVPPELAGMSDWKIQEVAAGQAATQQLFS